jgi:hypothetical protein
MHKLILVSYRSFRSHTCSLDNITTPCLNCRTLATYGDREIGSISKSMGRGNTKFISMDELLLADNCFICPLSNSIELLVDIHMNKSSHAERLRICDSKGNSDIRLVDSFQGPAIILEAMYEQTLNVKLCEGNDHFVCLRGCDDIPVVCHKVLLTTSSQPLREMIDREEKKLKLYGRMLDVDVLGSRSIIISTVVKWMYFGITDISNYSFHNIIMLYRFLGEYKFPQSFLVKVTHHILSHMNDQNLSSKFELLFYIPYNRLRNLLFMLSRSCNFSCSRIQ